MIVAVNPKSIFIIGIIIFIASLLILIISLRKKSYLNKSCTYEIQALCIREKITSGNDPNAAYSPVYEIYYNGRRINVSSNIYTPKRHSIGTEYTIKINPDNPTEFVDESNSSFSKNVCTISIVLMVVGLITAILSFFIK